MADRAAASVPKDQAHSAAETVAAGFAAAHWKGYHSMRVVPFLRWVGSGGWAIKTREVVGCSREKTRLEVFRSGKIRTAFSFWMRLHLLYRETERERDR